MSVVLKGTSREDRAFGGAVQWEGAVLETPRCGLAWLPSVAMLVCVSLGSLLVSFGFLCHSHRQKRHKCLKKTGHAAEHPRISGRNAF